MSSHTPGPWKVSGSVMERKGFINPMIECDEEHEPLLAEIYGQDRSVAEKKANARLIAKAPEMYDALHAIHDEVIGCSPAAAINLMPVIVGRIRALLAELDR